VKIINIMRELVPWVLDVGSGEGVRIFWHRSDGSVVDVTYQQTVATVENIMHDRMKVQQQLSITQPTSV
jgi:hypothetical protein